MNDQGELIASGMCEVDRERAEVTMWPSWELHMLERELAARWQTYIEGARVAALN